ncbi:MAG TPA: S-layer homology domain-containing protein, partial [Vicinamibacteria bacterium]|nr:S-layer homology domain-containing protein [Vicinamibacteria bacterium]
RPAAHWDALLQESLSSRAAMRWTVHVGASFVDVPPASGFYRFVETVLHSGVTGGCAADRYCPDQATTREQMAVMVLAAREGAGYRPVACQGGLFADVPPSSPFCPFIEELARRGVVGGCGGGNYCPGLAVARQEMAVFVLRTAEPDLQPPACGTPLFADVPASSPFCRWIEELARRGVVSGCGGGNFCPQQPVTRAQVAVFLSVAFGLTLYGP